MEDKFVWPWVNPNPTPEFLVRVKFVQMGSVLWRADVERQTFVFTTELTGLEPVEEIVMLNGQAVANTPEEALSTITHLLRSAIENQSRATDRHNRENYVNYENVY